MTCLLGGVGALAPGGGVQHAVEGHLREQVLRGGNVRDRALLHACPSQHPAVRSMCATS